MNEKIWEQLNLKQISDLVEEMRVGSINIDDVLVYLVKYQDEYKVNISELFASDKEREYAPSTHTAQLSTP